MTVPGHILRFRDILLTVSMIGLGVGCSGQPELSDSPIRVQVQAAARFNGNESFSYSGAIEASESTPLSFAVTGTTAKVLVSEGDFVLRGQLLAELNDATMKSALQMAQASLDRAEDAYKRLKPMHDNGSLPEIKFVEAETGLQQARAAAAIAQKNLNDCKLYAPVEGFVGSRSIEPGMNVVPGVTAINLLNIDSVSARVSVSEKEIAQIVKDRICSVSVGALRGKTVKGVIDEIGIMADPIAHTYKIKILLPNANHAMKPGMICDARIPIEDAMSGIVVPNQAVRVDEHGRTFVYVVDIVHSKAIRRYVESGRLISSGIEIQDGLRDGQLVVIAGQQKLVDGCLVEIVK
ncbi:MAG: efflux RND transporter periplasmic adaptor subunit [Candidatus Zixiibacteriota bacterium]